PVGLKPRHLARAPKPSLSSRQLSRQPGLLEGASQPPPHQARKKGPSNFPQPQKLQQQWQTRGDCVWTSREPPRHGTPEAPHLPPPKGVPRERQSPPPLLRRPPLG
ncbi:unnamed protein product, partial [Ectocarpus sp. 12 AP-2014]